MSCCEYNRVLGVARLNANLLSSQSLSVISSSIHSSFIIQLVIKTVCFGIGGSINPSEKAIQRIAHTIQENKGMKKPMQVAGCVVGNNDD